MENNDTKTNENIDPILKQKAYKTPERFNEQFHPKAIRILGSLGLNNTDIANCLNISYPTYTKWIRTKEVFSKALKEGRANRYEYALNEGYTYNEYQQLLSNAIKTIHDQEEQIEQLKNELNNRYRPNNSEHERQMKLLNEIAERQNTKPIINKENNIVPINPISGQCETDAQLNNRLAKIRRQMAIDFPDDDVGYMW
jgi:hypothetical protein